MGFLLIFLGAGIGGVVRQGVNVGFERFVVSAFPFSTLAINITGSFAMGAITALFALRTDLSPDAKLFLTTGVLGGFTTFSTFSLDVVSLWQGGHQLTSVSYALASVLVAVLGLVAGMLVVRLAQ